MTIREWYDRAVRRLEETGCPDPGIDARWIAEDLLGMTAAQLRFEGGNILSDADHAALGAALARRADGEPVQYILGSADFMGMRFYVDPRVLIPRADTEILVERAVIALQGRGEPSAVDLCTGSGAVGLSLKALVPHARVTLTDLSRDALEVARRNARALDIEVTLKHGDLFQAVPRQRFDLIVSNPPYIPTGELDGLQREVRREPRMALDGGADGLELYRRLLEAAPEHMETGAWVCLEVGAGEAEAVLEMGRKHIRCADLGIVKDLGGVERVVWFRSV